MKLHQRERKSIADFLQENADKLAGKVLDLGCGQQPYRRLIKNAGGNYTGHDGKGFPGSVVDEDVGPSWSQLSTRQFDAVVMTQVWQYMEPDVLSALLCDLASGIALRSGGWLLATGPTNWPVKEPDDLWRYTPSGVEFLLARAGFVEWNVEPRFSVKAESVEWLVGWQAFARSK